VGKPELTPEERKAVNKAVIVTITGGFVGSVSLTLFSAFVWPGYVCPFLLPGLLIGALAVSPLAWRFIAPHRRKRLQAIQPSPPDSPNP
jgi:hypothetical protein